MTAIAHLMFCNDCGELLPASTSSKAEMLTCDVCGVKWLDKSAKKTIAKSKPSDYSSELRRKRDQFQAIDPEDAKAQATTNMLCDKCGTEQEVRYYEQQLRSADEGTTVFYTCTACGNRWNTNN